jgi:hypothetical protein
MAAMTGAAAEVGDQTSTKLTKPVIEESVVVKVQRKTSSLRAFILSPRLGPFHSLPGSSLKVRHGGRRAGR